MKFFRLLSAPISQATVKRNSVSGLPASATICGIPLFRILIASLDALLNLQQGMLHMSRIFFVNQIF